MYRVSVDIGGTFTDMIIVDAQGVRKGTYEEYRKMGGLRR
jgi:N-methylhydantoinase A/oxoprolinase/acetone carboxylase beta subunit